MARGIIQERHRHFSDEDMLGRLRTLLAELGVDMCLLAATPEKDLIDTDKNKILPGMKPEDIARMEREMELRGRDFLMIEDSHGRNTLNLVLAVAYLRKILDNASVVKYLSQRHPDILSEFQKLAESPDLKSAS